MEAVWAAALRVAAAREEAAWAAVVQTASAQVAAAWAQVAMAEMMAVEATAVVEEAVAALAAG